MATFIAKLVAAAPLAKGIERVNVLSHQHVQLGEVAGHTGFRQPPTKPWVRCLRCSTDTLGPPNGRK